MKKKNAASAEFKKSIEKLTKAQAYEMLEEKVAEINENTDPEKGAELNAECAELCKKYAELSKHTTFAVCMKAEYPVLEFAKTFNYPTVKLEDDLVDELDEETGKMRYYPVRKIVEDKKRLDLYEFLTWAEKRNKQVTAKKNWRTPCRETRNSIVNEWKKILESNAEKNQINKKLLQENLQKMYDALLFIPSENNNNRVMATKKMAGMLFGFSNIAKDKVNEDGNVVIDFSVMPEKQWVKLTMYALHLTVKDKDYAPNPEVGYCVEEEVVEAEAETK